MPTRPVLQTENSPEETAELRNLPGVLDCWNLGSDGTTAIPGSFIWARSKRARSYNLAHNFMKLDQGTYMDLIRWREYWNAYQAHHFIRLPAEAVADVHAAIKMLGAQPVNWYCSGCVTEALRIAFEAVEEYERENGTITITKQNKNADSKNRADKTESE
jgi:hypothetical protein